MSRDFTRVSKRDNARLRSAERIERLDPVRLSADRPHGTRLRYMAGCKCMLCRAANSSYEVERSAARKAGDWNGIVPADAARAHIEKLSRSGVGRRAIAETCDVGETIIQEVKSGRRINIRKRTETKILAVSVEAAADGAYIDGTPTWEQIRELLTEGFSKAELARRLGKKTPALQLRRKRMRATSAAEVDRLYRKVMAGA